MRTFARAAVIAAGFAAVFAVATPVMAAAKLMPSLLSFGDSKAISAYELSGPGVAGVALQPAIAASLNNDDPLTIASGVSTFASSAALSSNLALDSGINLDIASRFTNFGASASPFLSAVTAPYLGLADGGRYAGVTFVPAANLRGRLGASVNSERLDRFSFDSSAPTGNLALIYDASETKSLLGGLSWDVTNALGLDVTGISAQRSGVPLGLSATIAPKASTNALGVAAHMDIGQGWVTTASFSEGMTQLDQRGSASATNLHEQAYAIAIAKHGLFGDDAVGLSFSQPAPSMAGSFSSLTSAGDLPPLVVGQNFNSSRTPETDISVGYVTNFLDGAVALQTNAAYQTNVQGQRGATSVSLLSRAKIKF
jgi:hypothetical protein